MHITGVVVSYDAFSTITISRTTHDGHAITTLFALSSDVNKSALPTTK